MADRHRTHLRAAEISRLLGPSTRTIRRWIADGTLPSVKLGGARLVAREDLERRLLPRELLQHDDDDPESSAP